MEVVENVTAVETGGSSSGLLIGSRLITHFLACVVTFFILLELWHNNKIALQKFWRRISRRDESSSGGKECVGGLEMVPGPRQLGQFFGNCFQFIPLHETLNTFKKFADQYGDAYKVGGAFEKAVVINSPEMIETMLKSTNFAHVVKSPVVYNLMKPFITNGVLVSRGTFWQHERKILLRSMSFQSLKACIGILNNHCERFVSTLETLFQDGQSHTINEEINASFLEIICEMITGVDIFGTAEGVEYHHNFQKWKESVAYRLIYPWFLPDMLWKLTPMGRETKKAVQGLFAFARRRIAEHREKISELKTKADLNNNQDAEATETDKKKDPKLLRSVLDELVDARVSDDQIVDEVNTMLFGGHETGASAIHFFCFAMAINPGIQEQCRKEVDEIFEDPMFTVNGRLSYEAVGSLKYVERCILETLRLYPPVWAFVRQLQAPLRTQIQGKPMDIPVGTNVCIISYILHRRKDLFPNPEQFNPDRFLPEECTNRHAYAFQAFSAGPRNCLGLKFGMMEMKVVAAYLIRKFIIKTTDKVDDVALLPNLTLTPARDYNFIFEKRNTTG